MLIKVTIGLRPDAEGEEDGLDQLDHGEAGYHPDEEGILSTSAGAHAIASVAPNMAGTAGSTER